jgi:positive regulator of sigma E activity
MNIDMKQITKMLPHYLPLLGIFVAAALAFSIFSYDKVFEVAIAVSVAVAYVAWGVVHHMIHKDLYPEVVIEYLVIASLGLVVLFSLIFRV